MFSRKSFVFVLFVAFLLVVNSACGGSTPASPSAPSGLPSATPTDGIEFFTPHGFGLDPGDGGIGISIPANMPRGVVSVHFSIKEAGTYKVQLTMYVPGVPSVKPVSVTSDISGTAVVSIDYPGGTGYLIGVNSLSSVSFTGAVSASLKPSS